MKGPPIGFALALPSNSKTQLERVTKGKSSSLLGLVISDEGIKFYNIDTRFIFKGKRSNKDISALVNELISKMRLQKCRNTYIGSAR